MKTYTTNQIRNIALLGNAGSGKTTLAESMLFEGKLIDRKGTVEAKNTVSDFAEIEHETGATVFSSLLFTEYGESKINVLDNPGADDFVGNVISSLHVADTGLMLLNAQNGVEVGTEIQARHVEDLNMPMIVAITHLDNDKSNFDKTIEMARERFGNHITLAQFPVNEGLNFNEIIDLLQMKLLKYPAEGGKPQVLDIPAEHKDRAEELHNQLVERAAESNESLMETFFEKGTLTEEEILSGIKSGLLNRGMFPVFCISSKKGTGVDRLLDFISKSAPSPDLLPSPKTQEGKEIKCDAKTPTALYIFKSSIETHIGEINYFKVMAGEINEGIDLLNCNTQNKERISQIFAVNGKTRTKVPKMVAGDLGATVKLKATKTNHTLTALNEFFNFPNIEFPEPKFRTAIKAVSEGDDEKLGEALHRMHQEDPTILIEYSKELKQILVYGQGEHHLNILKWHLDHIFKVATEFLPPRIPYRETITKAAQADYRHKKQSGGAGQFGEVHMIIEPYVEGAPNPTMYKFGGKEYKVSVRDTDEQILPWGGKLVYHNCIVGGSIDARFMPAIMKGLMEKMEEGPLTGSYARDIRICVYDGKMHPVDSNEISFRLAGRNAFKTAFKNAGPKILEPMYMAEILVPADAMGDVISDLQGRRGLVLGMGSERGFEKITAKVPLAEMNKYSTALASLTGGRGIYSMKFSEYAPVPSEIQDQLLKAYEAEEQED
jgi:elongation factor G